MPVYNLLSMLFVIDVCYCRTNLCGTTTYGKVHVRFPYTVLMLLYVTELKCIRIPITQYTYKAVSFKLLYHSDVNTPSCLNTYSIDITYVTSCFFVW